MAKPIPLKCACGTTVATIENGCLVIKAKHHGDKEPHVATFALAEIALQVGGQVRKSHCEGEVRVIDDFTIDEVSIVPRQLPDAVEVFRRG
jgi:hypothetical protein